MSTDMKNRIYPEIEPLLVFGQKLTVEDFMKACEGAPAATVFSRIRSLVKSGRIFPVSKGVYQVGFRMEYHPEVSERMQLAANIVQSSMIGEDFCIHEDGDNLFVEISRKAVTQTVKILRASFPNVLTLAQYHAVAGAVRDCIVVKYLVSESPLISEKSVRLPSLEKLLVDMTADQEYTLLPDDKLQFEFQKAFEVYRPDVNRMIRYASRRGVAQQVRTLIDGVKQDRVEIISKIQNFFRNQPIQRAWVFGSFSRGEERPDSDIDLLVDYQNSKRMSLLDIIGIKSDLEDSICREVDFIENGRLKPFAIESANQNKYSIYERRS